MNEESPYLIHHGVRYVRPYPHTYHVHAKGRWIGKTLVDAMAAEYRRLGRAYVQAAVERGTVTVNDERVQGGYVIRDRDRIAHVVHRHEVPVPNAPVVVVEELADLELLVVNKPAGLPVHPCGRFHKNSVTGILEHRRKQKLFPVHRLDRFTSGVLLLATTAEAAKTVSAQLRADDEVHKMYLARVKGEFPDEEVRVDEPIHCVNKRNGVNVVDRELGKPSTSVFRAKSYDAASDTSVVECKPVTGRTHQLRVHLQWLGHPIANDPCYGGEMTEENSMVSAPVPMCELDPDSVDPACAACRPSDAEQPRYCTSIWLHAISYTIGDRTFTVPAPSWSIQ